MIETKRLIIRPVTMQDAEDIFEYAQDSETGPRAGWPPHQNIDETKEILQKWLSYDSNEKNLAIVEKQSFKVIGTIGYTYLNKTIENSKNYIAKELVEKGKNVYEIGITVSRSYWGKGIGTESLQAMIDYLFKQLDVDVILTLHFKENKASEKIQQKNNMKYLGEFDRGEKWYNTNCTTMFVRGKTRQEWINDIERV